MQLGDMRNVNKNMILHDGISTRLGLESTEAVGVMGRGTLCFGWANRWSRM